MNFTELSLAENDSGLSFDEERRALIGKKGAYGVTVADTDDEYIVRVFAKEPYKAENEISRGIIKLSESLSKNTINSQCCEYGFVEVKMNKICLLQEKLILLIDFLDKLTELMENLGIMGAEPVPPPLTAMNKQKQSSVKSRKIHLGFDFGSIKGLLGALIAVFAMSFISTLVITYNENASSSLTITLSWWTSAAVPTLLIFFDYRFLAKKLDAFGIIICPLMSILNSFLSTFFISAKSAARLTECSFAEGFGRVGSVAETNEDFANFISMYLIESIIVSVAVSIAVCLWYFSKHPDEMFKAEITPENNEKQSKK